MKKIIFLFLVCALLPAATPTPSAVTQGEKKTAYAVLVDNTVSLKKRLPEVKMITLAVAKQVLPRGPILLMDFKLNPNVDFYGIYDANDAHEGRNSERASGFVRVDWTEDGGAISNSLEMLTAARGNTDLHGAVQSLAEQLNAKTNAAPAVFEHKVIILITDGEHRMALAGSPDAELDESKEQQEKLVKTLKQSGIRVFVIGLLDDLNAYSGRYRSTTRRRAEWFLNTITKQTGGRAVFPGLKKLDADKTVTQLLVD